MQHVLRHSHLAVTAMVAAATLFGTGSRAQANFISDNTDFSFAFAVLRSAIGDHARVLQIEVDQNGIEIEAQDLHNRSHINLWRYGTSVYFGLVLVKRLSGPQPVDPQLINPDLEANLFDLDSIDLGAAPKLIGAAIARAQLQDAATVTHIEIARQSFILPKPTSGDTRWTLRVDSGRERAKIYANAKGIIVGGDVSDTQRAKNLDLLKETTLAADAAAEFRNLVGNRPVLTAVGITPKTVSFATNIPDTGWAFQACQRSQASPGTSTACNNGSAISTSVRKYWGRRLRHSASTM